MLDAGLTSAPKLGTVRVRPDLGVAWIACPRRERTNPLSRAPECTRPGRARNTVFVAPAGADEARRVDRGRAIDPLSLRLDGRRMTWRHGERRRSTTL